LFLTLLRRCNTRFTVQRQLNQLRRALLRR